MSEVGIGNQICELTGSRADCLVHDGSSRGKEVEVQLLQNWLRQTQVRRPQLAAYSLAVIGICVCALIARLAWPGERGVIEKGLMLTGVALTSVFLGRGPGLAATVVGTLISGGFFANPGQFLRAGRPEQDVAWLLSVWEGLGLAWLLGPFCQSRVSGSGRTEGRAEGTSATSIDYQRIVDAVKGCAILMIDTHGFIRSWTDAGARMTGFSAEAILGQPLSLLDADPSNAGTTLRRAMELARQGGNGAVQARCLRKDRTEFWADMVIGTVFGQDGQLLGYSVVLRDITARKQAEDLLEQRSRQLIEASRLKDEFLATVSHELRTPLNSILGWVQLFRTGRLDETGRGHALETIEQSAKTQARLIEDLLDVSRIVSGKLRLEVRSVQLADVIQAAVETIRPAAEAKNITLDLQLESTGIAVVGDPNRLQQVIWNLLSNAIKFTPNSGQVTVTLRRQGSLQQVVVSDNGIGIAPEFLPHIFDAFRQADSSSTRSHKGLGLGLSIVRRLIELHGGTVRAESSGAGCGTSIEILLPVTSTPKSAPVLTTIDTDRTTVTDQTVLDPGRPASRLHVVLVDDDPAARELVWTVLTQHGIHVEAVASAAEGLEAVARVLPDVIISDIEMPDADGYMFMRDLRVREPERGGRTPAIALTAYTRPEDRSRSLAAGFQMHLGKPIEAEELVSAITALAKLRWKGSHAETTHH